MIASLIRKLEWRPIRSHMYDTIRSLSYIRTSPVFREIVYPYRFKSVVSPETTSRLEKVWYGNQDLR